MNFIKKFIYITILSVSLLISLNIFASDKTHTQAELAQLVSPIALYPDSMLSHILLAARYPIDIVQAQRWLDQANPDEQDQPDLNPSVIALLQFPDILYRMNQDLQWTESLGLAYEYNEKQVLDSVQYLRQQARLAGSLDKMQYVRVEHTHANIRIISLQHNNIYLPYYDTSRVYGQWHWQHSPPIHWVSPYHNNFHTNLFHWSPRVSLSFSFGFAKLHWNDRHISVHHHNYPQHWAKHYNRKKYRRHSVKVKHHGYSKKRVNNHHKVKHTTHSIKHANNKQQIKVKHTTHSIKHANNKQQVKVKHTAQSLRYSNNRARKNNHVTQSKHSNANKHPHRGSLNKKQKKVSPKHHVKVNHRHKEKRQQK